jgi:hypothetical protein
LGISINIDETEDDMNKYESALEELDVTMEGKSLMLHQKVPR